MPVPAEVEERSAALRALVAHHNRRYHELESPEIADAEYDALARELRDLETAYPELAVDESPAQVVGGAPNVAFAPVAHRVPMMSLDNAMDGSELAAWGERTLRGLADAPLRGRAEDRRARHEPAIRGRSVRAGRDPRRRPGR